MRNTSPYLLVETEELVYTVESLGEPHNCPTQDCLPGGQSCTWAKSGLPSSIITLAVPQWLSLVEPLGYSWASLS